MKRILSIFCSLCFSSMAFAQATTMTVDCQTPGWLSSKINYKDQLSLENLTVTGYLNGTDFTFLGKLPKLKHLDLSEVEVTEGNGKNLANHKLEFISQPKSNKNVFADFNYADTIQVNAKGAVSICNLYDSQVAKALILSEGVDSLTSSGCERMSYVHLPSTLHYIGPKTFTSVHLHSDRKDSDFLMDININDSIYNLGHSAITAYLKSDTIRIPSKLKTWYTCSFGIRNKSVIYIPKSVEYIDDMCGDYDKYHATNTLGDKELEIYVESPTPIKLRCRTNVTYKELGNCRVHVPIGCTKAYKDKSYFGTEYNAWADATIVEDRVDVTGIELEQTNVLLQNIGETVQLVANVLPSDASNKNVTWYSSNPSVAVVSGNGLVVCVGEGTAVIFATTEDGGFMATCTINAVMSGIDNVEVEKHISVENGTIKILGVENDVPVKICDVSGKLFLDCVAEHGKTLLTPYLPKGIYIVRIGDKIFKINI